jgi:hypothetical protein
MHFLFLGWFLALCIKNLNPCPYLYYQKHTSSSSSSSCTAATVLLLLQDCNEPESAPHVTCTLKINLVF